MRRPIDTAPAAASAGAGESVPAGGETAVPPSDRATFGAWRSVQDMRQRTRLGGAFYLLAWLLCWAFGPAPMQHLVVAVLGAASFGALALARMTHRPPPEGVGEAVLRRWLQRHWALLLLTSGSWGVAAAWAVSAPEPAAARLIAIVATVAFATALVFTFPMERGRATVGALLLCGPVIAALGLQGRAQSGALLTLLFYLLYLLLALRREHSEYHGKIDLAHELLEQRERFRALSRTDPLTRLGNRLQFNAVLPVLAAQARRHGGELALAMFDIDWFKRINDGHGHAAGDACLVVFAGLMRQTFRRDGDVLVRLGGEEFGVLMPDTPLAQAWQRAESFRRLVASSPVPWRDRHIGMTTSGAVGAYAPAVDLDTEQLVQRVDRGLYAAKAGGRDRIIAIELPPMPPPRRTRPGALDG